MIEELRTQRGKKNNHKVRRVPSPEISGRKHREKADSGKKVSVYSYKFCNLQPGTTDDKCQGLQPATKKCAKAHTAYKIHCHLLIRQS